VRRLAAALVWIAIDCHSFSKAGASFRIPNHSSQTETIPGFILLCKALKIRDHYKTICLFRPFMSRFKPEENVLRNLTKGFYLFIISSPAGYFYKDAIVILNYAVVHLSPDFFYTFS
jgi:hypothetical protein